MGKRYRQLSLEEREKIGLLKAEGRGPSEIGRLVGRDRKTIERELVRNAAPINQGYYLAHKADARATKIGDAYEKVSQEKHISIAKIFTFS